MLLLILSLVSIVLYLLGTRQKVFLWLIYFTIYAIIVSLLNGTHYSSVFFMSKFGNKYIWGETVSYKPEQIMIPKEINTLKKIVKACTKCRVVGSRHSFSPLIVTNETQIDLKYIKGIISDTGSEVTYLAGTTIEEVLIYLSQRNRTLHGMGSIHSQTLGGALSTSLVGVFPTSFSSHVTKVKSLNSEGEEVIWNNPYFVRNSMGMLGVIIEVTLKTYDNKLTEYTSSKMFIQDILTFWNTSNFIASDTSFTLDKIRDNRKVPTVYNYETNKTFQTQYPLYWNSDDSLLFELFVSPISWFFYFITHDTLNMAINPQNRETALLGVDREQYGFTYTDYIVPLESCYDVLKNIAEIDNYNPLVRMKYLKDYNTSCLDPTQTPSCRLEFYESHSKTNAYEKIKEVQNVIFQHNGFVHWGKIFLGDITGQMARFPCYALFEEKRVQQDPTKKFINDYLEGKPTEYNTYGQRKWILGFHFLCIIPLIFYFFHNKK